MRHSWFMIQGRPDFCLRSAFFQALVTGSIPVMNDDYYLDCVPYADMIDYTQVGGSSGWASSGCQGCRRGAG
jgi:hypothetical protein